MPSGTNENADSVAAAIAAIKKAADALSETAAATANRSAPESTHQPSTNSSSHGADDVGSQRYYQDLLQRGELVDVDETTELSQLPPHVTHVRLPDGRVRRIGYS